MVVWPIWASTLLMNAVWSLRAPKPFASILSSNYSIFWCFTTYGSLKTSLSFMSTEELSNLFLDFGDERHTKSSCFFSRSIFFILSSVILFWLASFSSSSSMSFSDMSILFRSLIYSAAFLMMPGGKLTTSWSGIVNPYSFIMINCLANFSRSVLLPPLCFYLMWRLREPSEANCFRHDSYGHC